MTKLRPQNSSLVFVLALTAWVACTSQPDVRKGVYQKSQIKNSAADLVIPKEMWSVVEKTRTGEADASGATFILVPLMVHLLEETNEALGGHNSEIEFAKGGGTLDLASFVDDNSHGDFIFGLNLPDAVDATDVHTFFLNNAKPRRIGGENYGTPCNLILELSTFFKKSLSQAGMRVTNRQKLYINLMVGSYIITYKKDEQWFATQLTVSDSRFPDLLCRKSQDPNA